MNRLCIAFAAAALVVGCQENPSDPANGTMKPDAQAAKSSAGGAVTTAGPIQYQEIRSADGKVYVVGSKEAAEQARAGKLEKPVRAIGFGAPGEKVFFEEKNEAALMAEYKKRHPGQ